MSFHAFFTPWTISALLFILLLALLLWRDRANVERHGIIFIRRTEKGIALLDAIAQSMPRLWRGVATIGVVLGFAVSIGTFFFLIANIINNFLATSAQPGLALVLPTLSTEPTLVPGALLTPFWHWVIAIFLVVLVHEGMHGVIGRVEDFKISSVGWGVLAILPLAFVEPEGEQNIHSREEENTQESEKTTVEPEQQATTVEGSWQGGTFWGRLRVLSAGSLGNFLLAALLGIVLVVTTTPAHGQSLEPVGLYDHTGVQVFHVGNETPAARANFPTNVTITHIGDTRITDVVTLRNTMQTYAPNDTVDITLANNQTYSLILDSFPHNNTRFSPKVHDYLFAYTESVIPVVEQVDKGKHPREQLARWQWIQEKFDFLDKKAERKISDLKEELRNTPFIGIGGLRNEVSVSKGKQAFEPMILFLMQLLSFVAAINLGVGMANLLPLKPLDGGLMWEELAQRKTPSQAVPIVRVLTTFTLLIIVASFATNFI